MAGTFIYEDSTDRLGKSEKSKPRLYDKKVKFASPKEAYNSISLEGRYITRH